MYLYKKNYVKNWSHMKPEELHEVTVKKAGEVRKDIKPERVSYITEDVMYWRKANAIHNWFVQNVQDGQDDCKDYWVSEKDLETLLNLCEEVLDHSELIGGQIENGYSFENGKKVPNIVEGKIIKDPTMAEQLLPVTDGFFFGSTDYDEYYYEDIKSTRDALKALLAEPSRGSSYYYHASW